MTDIIKDFAEKASNKMMNYLRNNKDFEEENILTFKQELTDLESDNPLLIAFGCPESFSESQKIFLSYFFKTLMVSSVDFPSQTIISIFL